MLISVINHTRGAKKVADSKLQEVIRAVNRQIAEDFAPCWGMSARLRLEGRAEAAPDEATNADLRGDAILYLLTTVADANGTLGFHDLNNAGVPYGFVYTELSEAAGENWSVTFSHEALELIADPEANLLVMGPHPSETRKVFHWFEMCDAVQAQTYKLDGVRVSNFVLPLYYTGSRDVDEPGARNNFLGTPLPSFGLTSGGYIGFYDPQKDDSDQVFADDLAKRRSVIKARGVRTRRAVRYSTFNERVSTTLRARARLEVSEAAPPADVAASKLRAGDVLLYRRNGVLSRAIRFFDGRPVSHASIYLGDGGVGEALGQGVVKTNLNDSVEGTEWVMARRLANDVKTLEPVLDRAAYYLGEHERYAYEEILLLALLGITRRVAPTGVAGLLLRKILDTAAETLNRLVSNLTAGKKEPMICSELVYRCYEEAREGDADYKIRIGRLTKGRRALDSTRGRGVERGSLLELIHTSPIAEAPHAASATHLGARAAATSASLEELFAEHEREVAKHPPSGQVTVTADVHRALSQFAYALQRTQAMPQGKARRAAGPPTAKNALDNLFATVKDFVTPGDLWDSPSLNSLGHIGAIGPIPPAQFAAAWKRAAKRQEGEQ